MTIFTDLISNVALLLALSILYSFLTRIWKQGEIQGQILTGILFGGVAVAGMILPFRYGPGLIFDGRSIVVSMAGLFGGPVTAVISTLIAGGYRLSLGGTGAFTGFLVILTSAALGVGYHYLRLKNPDIIKTHYLLVFGVIVHISMLLCMLTLPWTVALEVLDRISIPVMLIFPFGTVFLGTLLADQEKRNYAQEALRESERKYRTLLENLPQKIFLKDNTLTYVTCNKNYAQDLKINPDDLTGKTDYDFYPKELAEKYRLDDNRIIESGITEVIQEKYIQGGKELFVQIVKTPVLDESGKVSGVLGIFWDITDQQRTEEALRASEEIFTQMFVQSKTSTQLFDPDGNCIRVNPAFCNLFGVTEKNMTSGYNILNDRSNINSSVMLLLEEIFNQKKSNTWQSNFDIGTASVSRNIPSTRMETIWIDVLGYPVLNKNGVLQYVALQHYDITEQKLVEESLRESEGKYRQIIEGATDVIFTTDYQGYCTYVNVPGEKLTGYTVDELVGMHFTKVISVDWRERVKLFYIKQIQGREDKSRMEFPITTKTGEKRWVEQIVTTLAEGNKITGFQSIVRDITDRKLAEEALRENEEKYRTILETMEEGYYEIDLAGNFTFVNDAMGEIQGYSMEELMGKNNRDFMTEETAKEVFNAYNNVYTTGKPARNLEWETKRKDGTKGRVETSVSLVKDSKGKPIGFRGVVRDITEKQILEAKLHKAQKMESIGTLAGGIAHNFNNLLMGIQGNASMMLLDIEPDNSRLKNLKSIEKLVDNGAKLAAQLIAYAREGKYEVKPINLNQLVKDTSDTFGMTKKQISIHQKLSEKLYGIKADQGQIEQVLLNLYVNAADAMPGGGVLFVKTMNVTDKDITDKLYEIKPGNYVLLAVKDTGVGMDKETRERIFEPFFTTKGLASGTGLGLASVYGIIKSHDGYIDVDSEKGKGTTFNIYLPATKKIIEEKKLLPEKLVKGKGTVLLVDDEEMILDAGEHMLKHLGYEVLLANDGQEALELYKLNRNKIDLVLLDMVMPVMGGGEAFDRMKEIDSNVKVLLSSGYSIEGEAKEILNRGCDAFIQKPFKLEHLSQKIEELLGKE